MPSVSDAMPRTEIEEGRLGFGDDAKARAETAREEAEDFAVGAAVRRVCAAGRNGEEGDAEFLVSNQIIKTFLAFLA